MQPKFRKNLLFWTLLACSGANWCCITQVDATLAANSDTQRNKQPVSIISSMGVKEKTHQPCYKNTSLKAMFDDKPQESGNFALGECIYAADKETIKYFQLSTTSETANFNHRLEKEAREQGAFSKGDSSDGELTPPVAPAFRRVRKPLSRSEGLGLMFSFAPQQEEGVISPSTEPPPSPCLFLELGNASRYNSSLYGVGSSVFNMFNCYNSPILYSQQPPPETTPPPNPPPPEAPPPPNPPPPPPNPPPREEPRNIPTTSVQRNEPPQLEGQPNDFPQTSPTPIEQLLEKPPLTNSERLDRLIRRLQEGKQTSPPSDSSEEIEIRARPIQLPPTVEQPPLPAQPVAKFKPIGSLRGYVGFFATNNIFSSEVDPIQDGLVFSGLTLASAPLALGPKTYLSAGIDGNLIFYIDQSQFNYNQIRFYVSIYQQLSRRMYGELGWSNQQLFYAKDGDFFSAGDRFLNENSLRLSLGRRDPLTQRLVLDSFYELRFNFADPDNRNRINNSLLLSLSYYWLRSLQVGLDYQFNLSDFTLRPREDQYHRLYTHLTYGISDSTNVSLQGGVSLGGSTDQNINFDGWFFSLNYNLELGKF
ncbi:hypothetical protein NIES4075_16900 [Tolypothrix sp. NIES-4075]|uniref:hypothetical protein n=1 Tax=Tolypothrix sp. NIES-4075 TaxID=2005459 RepID=UPI000B7082FF|nr:hypothetical protein [Tolypothrix sp. NIES-4075]GAX40724.1 hypothetical protein NIES4075_16900 [Tolypothrix sp. NIES-4075]